MKKTIRILTVSLIAIFAFALAAIGFSFKVNAADIELEQGASIRVDTSESGYSGLRFSAKIDDALMGTLFSEGAYKENVTVSMLIAPEKAFEAYSYRSEAQSSLNYLEFFKAKYGFEREQISADIPAEKIIDGVVKGVLKVNEANYGMKYQAVVYYTTDGGATYVFSGKSVARSVSCVASAAKNYTEIPEQLESGVATFIGGDLGETSHSFENGVCTVCGTTPEIVGGVHGVAVDLGISYDDMRKPVSEQTSGISAPVTIDLGKDYGAAKNISYDGVKDSEITLSGANLTVPAKYFGTDAIGKHEIYIRTEQGAVSVPLYVATKIIKTTNEFNTTFRSMAANVKAYGYFVLGNDLDYEGNALGDAYSLNCGGLCGTFDGREYNIRNFNTANQAGLFVTVAYANNSVIKNVNFTDLVHTGTQYANVFGYSIGGATFENITINVKSSAVVDGLTMSTRGMGFICGTYMDKCTFKNITVNAEGQEIYSLFGYWCKRASATAQPMTCENVVVNAKKVYYLGREDGNGDKIIYDTATYGNGVAGLTINVAAEKQDITKELYETGTNSYLVDLGVTDISKAVSSQTLAGNSVSLNIGEGYGTLSSVEFNGAIDGATYENGILTFPLGANFSAGHAGTERTIVMTSSSDTANYTLNIHVLFATKVIKTTNDIQSTFRSQTSKPTVYGYFVLGNDLDYEGKALSNHEGGDSEGGLGSGLYGTFDGRGYTIKNFNTGNKYGLFVKIASGTGAV